MKTRNRDLERIETAFVQARRSSSRAEVAPWFRQKVMARILEESETSRVPVSNGFYAGHAVWRLALLSYLVVVMLAAHLMMSDLDSQYQLSRFILDDSSSLDLMNTFGVL
jgi:hypothetical protein